jgi:hypothetical protein
MPWAACWVEHFPGLEVMVLSVCMGEIFKQWSSRSIKLEGLYRPRMANWVKYKRRKSCTTVRSKDKVVS